MKARLLFLLLSAAALLAAWKITAAEETVLPPAMYQPMESVTIAVAADLHYLPPELTDHGSAFQRVIEQADGKVMEYSEELLEAFTEQIIAQTPDVLILAGDLTFNGERASHETLAQKLRCIADAGIRVLVLPGNHDLENPMAAAYQEDGYRRTVSISSEEFEALYGEFGPAQASSRDDVSLSYVAELSQGLWVLAIDANQPDTPGCVKAETVQWAEQQLLRARESGARVLSVSHQSLLRHNALLNDGFQMENSAALTALYQKYGVLFNLAGHLHVQHIASQQNVTEILTSSLAVAPNQYGILTVTENGADYHTVPVDVSAWAKAHAKNETALLHFEDYAADFFYSTAYRQAVTELTDAPDAEAMADYFARVNAAYFAGRMDRAPRDADLLQKWRKQGSFLAAYLLQSMTADFETNFTQYYFTGGTP